MAKDYAKNKVKKKKSGASRGNKNKAAPKGLILTAIILVAGLTTLLVYLKWYQPAAVNKQNSTQKNLSNTKKLDNKVKDIDDEVPFYKTHKEIVNKTVEIPIEDLKLPESKYHYKYLMPCGSFREAKRADELKAKIAFSGYESNINKMSVKSGKWYRVELGPFKSKRKAEAIRHRLQDNGFDYCLILPQKIL